MGSGKSQALCHEAIKLELHQRGAERGCWVRQPIPMLRDATQRTFLESSKANEVRSSLNKSETLGDDERHGLADPFSGPMARL